MSIEIGDLNIANEIIELHYQVLRTQLMLDKLSSTNPSLRLPDEAAMKDLENKAIEMLQKKFPNMGIKRK